MPKQRPKNAEKNTVVVRMRKSHRIMIITLFALLSISMLAAMIYVISSSELGPGIDLLLLAISTIPFLPLPLYYTTWQITFDADGIHRQLLGIKQRHYSWMDLKEVHSAWLIAERNYGIRIIFKDGRSIRFRLDCENAEKAKKLILSHCSIAEKGGRYE